MTCQSKILSALFRNSIKIETKIILKITNFFQVAAAWSTKIDVDTRLEQDQMEGVDEAEWDK